MRNFPFAPYLAGLLSILLGIGVGYFLQERKNENLIEEQFHKLAQDISRLEELLIRLKRDADINNKVNYNTRTDPQLTSPSKEDSDPIHPDASSRDDPGSNTIGPDVN